MKNMMIGVDLAKTVFQVHGALRTGEVQFRKKLTRKQFPAFMAQQEPSMVIFEACGSAHFWAREMEALGHEVKLIAPQYVRPFVKAKERRGGRRGHRHCSTASRDAVCRTQINGSTGEGCPVSGP
ncbi:MAG: hypothetical protein ACK5JT_16725 [Hyphomicrobiaceae bacterium]